MSSREHTSTQWSSTVLIATGVTAFMVAALLINPASAQEKHFGCWGTEMRLNLIDTLPWVTAIHPASGWQITPLLRAKECRLLGIGVADFPPVFPGADKRPIFIVFDDPDHCPSFLAPGFQLLVYDAYYCDGSPDPAYPDCVPPDWGPQLTTIAGSPCPVSYPPSAAELLAWGKDETWLEITPGRSLEEVVPDGEEDELGPLVWNLNMSSVWHLSPVGPTLGTTGDDVRYGSWRRMPGLVVLADHGPGLLTVDPDPTQPPSNLEDDGNPVPSDFFDPQTPLEAWNLAGLFNSATYSLLGGNRETSALAHLNVPGYLMTPVVLIDKHITNETRDAFGVLCEPGNSLYRMDGGPLTCAEGTNLLIDGLLNETVVTLRVFAVDGDAPDILIDMNYDGRIDIHDARRMGLKPITPEAKTRFRQHHEIECGWLYDFDGDGNPGGCGAGARPGGITRPPR